MIRVIEALNYRCLRYVRQPLESFQILIGPNASGKTTFLDVVSFLSDLLTKGLDQAITGRSTDLHDLFFCRQGNRFELAVEMEAPADRVKRQRREDPFPFIRYEIAIGIDKTTGEYHIFDEQAILMRTASKPRIAHEQRTLFPAPLSPPDTIMHSRSPGKTKRRTVRKVYDGNDNFYSEIVERKGKGGWAPSIRLGPRKSALGNMPEDESRFPVTTWLRDMLINGTQKLMLNSVALRRSSRPGQGRLFKPDGSNLPWVIEELRQENMGRYREWIAQLKTALPDIEDVVTVELPDTKHRFLQIVYAGGLKIPSWTASDGTLRMLALTLPAYLPYFEGIYLIEEPENGIQPQRTHRHAMLIFDRDGSGADNKPREEIERDIESALHASGWAEDRVGVITIEPELEVWTWSASPRVAEALGWNGDRDGLRQFLANADLWAATAQKPNDPKQAMRLALKEKRKPFGAPVFSHLASRVGLDHCQDPAFCKFRMTLQRWFPCIT